MSRTIDERSVVLNVDGVNLRGDLRIPPTVNGVILFAHGSGSSRKSPRNRFVAEKLNESNLATLLIDLLTEEEEVVDQRTGHLRFDIGLLADRLSGATDWLKVDPEARSYPIGYFGASTGAAAALVASVQHPSVVKAVVSRGGRPDLANSILERVTASTLLIVGGLDVVVIDLNQEALEQIHSHAEMKTVPGASHLFEEPGKLDEVAKLAADWFSRYLNDAA